MMERATPRAGRAATTAARLAGVALLFASAGCSDSLGRSEDYSLPERSADEVDLLERVLVAEDARASSDEAMAPLTEALASSNTEAHRLAVRALGRFERESLIPQIIAQLDAPEPGIRAEAANALAQAVLRADPTAVVPAARAALLQRLQAETDGTVRGALAQSAGRTRHAAAADVPPTALAIVGAAATEQDAGSNPSFAKGLYMLARQPAARGVMPEPALAYLRGLLAGGTGAATDTTAAQRVRTLAMMALAASGHATGEDLRTGAADPNPFVRREAVVAAATFADRDAARTLISRALQDEFPAVRYDAVRGWGRIGREDDCTPIASAAGDEDVHVALLAIDLLSACPALPGVADMLDSLVQTAEGSTRAAWHRGAHALVALATVEPDRAAARLPTLVAHESPFARAYAATAASVLEQSATLRQLAEDAHPNVRVAALTGLAGAEGRAADGVLIEQLGQDDPQLVMTSADLLEGTRDAAALPALLSALERFSTRGRETERDARMALLARIEELGTEASADRLRPMLGDYDSQVADRAAAILSTWTGGRVEPSPAPPQQSPVPSPLVIDSLERSVFTVEMADGSSFEMRLRAWDAPTNAARFARLAGSGYFDGLTYHRVVPNFVVQGGSPGANEYAGDGAFSRDELGLDGNWRGTVGVSTRGRDTGDAQMFLNLVDNIRLDHEYTVFAEVVRGMGVVDRLLEGAQIRTIRRTAGP
jgi:cyclophilin family peptidyl-prolyl cis-trans isomerase/HEAT repeat protein